MPPADAAAAGRNPSNSAPQAANAAPPAEEPAAADAPADQPASKPAMRAFNASNATSLAQRIRPGLPTDLPDAPVLGPADGSAGSVNLGAMAPAQILMPPAPAAAKTAPEAPAEIRQPQLTSIVKPEYPDIARRQGVSGVVSLSVTIGADGRIKTVKPLAGPELLRRSAMDAVKQWVYTPATVNGRPVDSEKQLDVTFSLPR
jgi:TonB family protein